MIELKDYPLCYKHERNFEHIIGYSCTRCGRQVNREEAKSKKPRCKYCIGEKQYYKEGITVTYYSKEIKHLLYRLKYGQQTYLTKTIAKMMSEKIEYSDYDLIIATPIHKRRRRQRGFNQSELIGHYLEKISNIPVDKTIITKTKHTPYLSKFDKQSREDILRDAFTIANGNRIKNKRLLLIDDIYTTGSTVNAISQRLNEYEPQSITVLTFCVGDYTK